MGCHLHAPGRVGHTRNARNAAYGAKRAAVSENKAVGSPRIDDNDPPRGKGVPPDSGWWRLSGGEPDQLLSVGQRQPRARSPGGRVGPMRRLTSPPHRHGPRHAARRYRRDRARPRRGRPAPRGRGPAVRIPKHRPPPRRLAFTGPSPGTPDGSAWQGISCPLAHPSPPFKSPADGLQRICPRRARRPWSRRQLLRGLSRLDDAPAAPSTADHRDSPPASRPPPRVLVCPESRAHVRRRTRALAYSAPDAPLRRDPRDPPSPSGSTLDDARHSPARDSGGSRKWT